ncbi:MAG: hypothetical protein AAF710_09510 [Planctomycetota bacterium]
MLLAIRRTFLAGLLAASLLVAGGCATGYGTDLTPELESAGLSKEQIANRNARVVDNNLRSIWDDLARAMLLDRTSTLQPALIP